VAWLHVDWLVGLWEAIARCEQFDSADIVVLSG
jgi:hypothetical protein